MVFQKCMRKAKLDEIYGYTSGANPKPLYRLTPHSLRHYAITNFCRKNGGNGAPRMYSCLEYRTIQEMREGPSEPACRGRL
jgi:hypothetical protein